MPIAAYIRSRKVALLQTAIANETNTDAGATWTAAEVTLLTSLRTKLNAVLAALTAAGVISTTGSGVVFHFAGKKNSFLQTDITDVVTNTIDATYAVGDEGAVINSLKAKLNSAITAMNNFGVLGGHKRFITLRGRLIRPSATIAQVTIADAAGTYDSGGTNEQGLVNDIKTKLNLLLGAMRAAKIIAP